VSRLGVDDRDPGDPRSLTEGTDVQHLDGHRVSIVADGVLKMSHD